MGCAQRGCNVGQPSAEYECINAPEIFLQRISKPGQEEAIGIHGPADVQQDHKLLLLKFSVPEAEINRLTPTADAEPQGSPQINFIAQLCCFQSSGKAQTHLPQQTQRDPLQVSQVAVVDI